MLMCHSNYKDVIGFHGIQEFVWKLVEKAFSYLAPLY